MTKTVADRVRAKLAECLDVPEEKVVPTARMVEDLYADSLDNIELLMDAEDEFDVEISDEEAEGVRTVADVVARAEAQRTAATLRAETDEYTVVIQRGDVVRVLKAKSQARGKMNAADFQASKTAILEWVADLLNVAPSDLARSQEPASPNKRAESAASQGQRKAAVEA